ncbi:Fe-S-containing hydro-lyase [Desulfitibacter alkalitolerans]|uniref:Fe-S-containing hydro-lyase n=1 Tax=Desulfitibacter alkalitolerans TaxID=264641 RepID=UPI0004859C6C|nr:Fe-S-containing hydro-lyase [Desulfitibacter alkalitolerans]
MEEIRISTPLDTETVCKLKTGDKVLISGPIYTARDAAHKRMIDMLKKGEELPFDIKGQVIYYVGPTPPKPGRVIGSAGPTTSTRMDAYAPELLKLGLKGMIGKGLRSQNVKDAISKYKGVYFAGVGGAAAVISKSIISAKLIAFEDLGPEAIRELVVKDFPAVVVNDCHGGDLYIEGREQFLSNS